MKNFHPDQWQGPSQSVLILQKCDHKMRPPLTTFQFEIGETHIAFSIAAQSCCFRSQEVLTAARSTHALKPSNSILAKNNAESALSHSNNSCKIYFQCQTTNLMQRSTLTLRESASLGPVRLAGQDELTPQDKCSSRRTKDSGGFPTMLGNARSSSHNALITYLPVSNCNDTQ